MDYSRPQLADRLAASYAAGTLRGRARRRFEALLPAHPALRAALQAWAQRLMPLTASVQPVQPPAAVWQRIQQQLGLLPAAVPKAAGWWQALGFWRGLAGLSSAAAVALAVLLAVPDPVQPPIVVVLESTQDAAAAGGVAGPRFVASISPDGRAVVTRALQPVSLDADRALELWAVPPDGAPRSLGLIAAKGASLVQKSRVPAGTAALAVSLEPTGGSPTGAPTGPVLYVGKIGI
jgi:anti-sigma-K factor RskA